MKTLLFCVFTSFTLQVRSVETNVFHPTLNITKLALLPNPVLSLKAQSAKEIRGMMDGVQISSQDLRRALRELLYLVGDTNISLVANVRGLTNGTARIHNAARTVTAYYLPYQRAVGVKVNRPDVKDVVENALLTSLKRIEWVAKRKDTPKDAYFHHYYSTLFRYFLVRDGWIYKDGSFVQPSVEKKS